MRLFGRNQRRGGRETHISSAGAWFDTAGSQRDGGRDSFDPLGSYTGRPADGGEPEQDADDL